MNHTNQIISVFLVQTSRFSLHLPASLSVSKRFKQHTSIMATITIRTSEFVTINISNSKTDAISFEKKFPKSLTIEDFKNKLEIVTGGSAGTMQLELYAGDKLVTKLTDNDLKLGAYPIEDGMRVHVIDQFLMVDCENVDKFELTEDQYTKKQDTVRNFLKTNKLGKYDDAEMQRLEAQKKAAQEKEEQQAKQIEIGKRCMVTTSGQPTRLGTVMFNGRLDGKKSLMIGVKFDLPLGVNDGSVNGTRYFDCEPKYGSFVIPSAVTTGDFPPEDDGLEDEI